MDTPHTFLVFAERTKHWFKFLSDEYGFMLDSTDYYGYEATVAFVSSCLRVMILYEMGSRPWVNLSRVEREDGRIRFVDGISLKMLLEDRGYAVPPPISPHDIEDTELDEYLRIAATNLRAVGADVLKGNVEPLRRLHDKATKEWNSGQSASRETEPPSG